ncbi:type III secretion system export apparatus subunit SctV [Aestuariibius sp. 2305UL40-4]|uniref:type III secretion system export apparatus subunit SctV n=1 Tax=Aestuariibius violaceus TaxID=3234132 RepID=UPI00345EB3F8
MKLTVPTRLMTALAASKDLSIGVLLVVTITLMILPMPTPLVDTLIGFNFGIAVLMLMTAIYLGSALELSSLPGIILISTIFRLALSVTTTRLILSQGDAGAIVDTFGAFVIAGNVVVGMVVFFIVTIVQFIVIAKGSERIAEVGARFTLDALPGKQMSIDAEMRNGDIDHAEAMRRRKLLERESQFYGAMDGAMKFVKGDAIAGLIIISVNLIGGLTIGMLQHGMSLGDAALKYSLLTVGDALISQIPALLISITAATIVTRVQGDARRNLGADIITQLVADRRAMRMAAVTVFGMGLLPGFPTLILFALAGIFAVGSIFLSPRAENATAPDDGAEAGVDAKDAIVHDLPESAPVILTLSHNLAAVMPRDTLVAPIGVIRSQVTQTVGLPCPAITMRLDETLEEDAFQILIDDVPVSWDAVSPDQIYADDSPEFIDLMDLTNEPVTASDGRSFRAFHADHAGALEAAGLSFLTPKDRILDAIEDTIVKNFASFIGIQETQTMLSELEGDYGALVAEVVRSSSVQNISDILRRLVQELVFPTNKRLFLEALAEWVTPDQPAALLTEYIRVSLSRQICHRIADANRVVTAIILERDTEAMLRDCLRETNVGTFLVLDEEQSDALISKVQSQLAETRPEGLTLVLMSAMDVRRHLKTFLTRNRIAIDVLSFQELADGFTVVPVSTLLIDLPQRTEPDAEAA